MSFADLTFDRWRRLDHAATTRYAQHIAGQLSGIVTRVETVQHLGAPLQRVVIARGSRNFALIPGGEVTIGFELEGWQPTPEQLASYRDETLTQGYGLGPDPHDYLALLLSPRRTVTLPAVLMAVENEALTAPPADVPAALAEDGLRVPTPDDWEHACGAGADTLFHWGNHCPLDRSPYGNATGPPPWPSSCTAPMARGCSRNSRCARSSTCPDPAYSPGKELPCDRSHHPSAHHGHRAPHHGQAHTDPPQRHPWRQQ